MKYQVIVCVSNNRLAAVNINKLGVADNISLEGNQEIEYSSKTDIDIFCQHIKDYYNIDKFSDIDMSVIILNVSAGQAAINYLYNAFCEVNSANIVDINIILPVLLLKEITVQPNTSYTLEIFGVYYQVQIDDELNCVLNKATVSEPNIKLDLDKFKILFNFCCKGMVEDEEKYNALQENHNTEISKLNSEKNDLVLEIQSKEEEIKRLNALGKNSKRAYCYFKFDGKQADLRKKRSSIIKYASSDGNSITKGGRVCRISSRYSNDNSFICAQTIKAEITGRIFHLFSNGASIKDGDIIAIIGSDSDTRADVLAWHEQNSKK